MSNMNKKPYVLHKGIVLDTRPEYQDQGTYRFALNAVRETEIGDLGAISNEKGNEPCFEHNLGSGFHLVGDCNIGNGQVLLFFTDSTDTVIGIVQDCIFKTLIRTECLGISIHDYVDVEYRVHNGCDTIIYFTDGHNKYRSINISKLNRYKKDNYQDPNVDVNGVYGWDCGLFNISPDYDQVKIFLDKVTRGGRLRIGSYQFAVRHMDDQYNPTGWSLISNPVPVTLDNSNSTHASSGGVYGPPDVDGFRYVDKSISIVIDNIDTRYNYYQIAILQATAGTFEVNEVHVTSPIPIESRTANFTLDSTSGLEVSSLQSVVVNNRVVPVVQAHTQVENRLILGNIKSPEKDWLQFQRVANNIQVEYVVYESEEDTEFVCGYDIAHGEGSLTNFSGDPAGNLFMTDHSTLNYGRSYSNPNVVFDNKTYMRDEVYALGIVFVFEDGSESPVMHIPGRPKLGSGPNAVPSYTVNGFNYTPAVGQAYWNDLREMYNTSGVAWDDVEYSIDSTLEPYVLSENNDPDDVLNKDSIHAFEDVYQSGNCSVNTIPRWKHVNTSIKRTDDLSVAYNQTTVERRYGIVEAGIMGYYETDTTYPKVLGCDGNPVFPYHLDSNGEIVMDKVRHHRMPDSRKSHIQRREIGTLTVDTPQGPIVVEYPILIVRPIGVAFHNIDLTGLNVSHYYFVKSDRAGNKTVLDKGWMNVTDLSCALVFDINSAGYRGVKPISENRTIEQNVIFMSPHAKSGMTNTGSNASDRNRFKDPDTAGGYDIVEMFSPKLVYNSIVNLGPSHLKLENTVYGSITKYRSENLGSNPRVSMACFFDRMDQPRVAVGARAFYALTHLVPIKSMEFALYNQVSASTMLAGYTIENDKFQQVMALAHLYDNIENYQGFLKLIRSPYMYGAISLPDGVVTSGVVDILTHNTQDAGEFNDTTPTSGGYVIWRNSHDLREIIDKSSSVNSNNFVGSAFRSFTTSRIGAYAYYVALKSSVTPYRKLDTIKYNRCSNYNFNSSINYTSTIVTGGDVFISPMRMYRSYFEGEDEENLNRRMFIASHLTGLVESEINCNYRHKDPSGLYMAYPFDSLNDTVDTQINELREDIRERIEQGYEYNLDLSRDNSARQLFALPDYYDYCLDCQESFPNLIIYSDQVNAEQVEDWYRAFQVNNIIEIPPDTGSIVDMTLKENSMFVHTQGNTWRLNISNQQIQTNNDVIEVGSNSLGNATPTKLFDNDSGLFRGGLEFKQSAVHCDDMYIWVDTITNHVYALQGGVKELSELGLKTWFDANLTMHLRDQFRRLSWLHYGVNRSYPYMNTSSAFDTGLIATYDPQIKRYILTKKDYELLPQFESTVIPIPDPPYSLNQIYLGVDGYYIATDANTLIRIEVNNNAFFRSKSWTISYDVKTNSWWSYHSYIPNYMYRDDDNYYSFIENPNPVLNSNYRNYLWAHNSNFYQTYYDIKQDFIIDFVYTSDAYQDKTFDNFELAVNSYIKDTVSNEFKNEQFIIPNLFYAYNNTQLSGYRGLVNTATSPYERVNYSITSSIDRDRNVWRVSRFRDISVNRLTSPNSMFTTAWTAPYSGTFFSGFGYIDKVINPNYISTSKNVYQQERFTDKYLGVRINWNNNQNAKINVNLLSALNRTRK